MSPFMFDLGQTVTIASSGEIGQIQSRAEHLNAEPSYYLRYKAADGRAVESWWTQNALDA